MRTDRDEAPRAASASTSASSNAVRQVICPPGIAPPKTYSHGVQVEGNARWLWIAGQIGNDAAGNCSDQFERQAEQACRNMLAVLHAAGMTPQNLVRTTTYITRSECIPAWLEVRARVLGDMRPSATLVVVSGLAKPIFMVEIDGVAVM